MSPQLPSGYQLVALDDVDSTNEHAKRLLAKGITQPTWIIAQRQTAGKGRQGHVWVSEMGNLFCTLILPIDVSLSDAANLSFVSALAVGTVLESYVEMMDVTYKWPNDVLLNDQKVSGILLETDQRKDALALIIGIGMNIQSSPKDVAYPATSLADYLQTPPQPDQIFSELAHAFDRWLDVWRSQGFAAIQNAWMAQAARLNQTVHVRLPDEHMTGILRGINEKGELLLKLASGQERRISAGDVYFDR